MPRWPERTGSNSSPECACPQARFEFCWPQGFVYSKCGHDRYCHLHSRDLFQCNRCKYQASLTRDMVFADTKLPLRTWFLAIYLLTQHKNGISAMTLRRQLGIGYNSA